PHWTVSSIVHVPGGAHPSYVQGYYGRDNGAYLEWDGIAADLGRFREWIEANVMRAGPEDFAGRVEALRKESR
ncbi:MAG TPA: hypothetical protein VFJ13_02625, partial [Paracoccaceae bacterium]|nr:hypothetical protein [Paracoccaceae bacterium]